MESSLAVRSLLPPTPHPAGPPTLCMPGTAVSPGSSVTLVLFSLPVWLASSRCNVPARGGGNKKHVLALELDGLLLLKCLKEA